MATYDIYANVSEAPLISREALNDFSVAVRTTLLVILLMLALVFLSALLAARPAFAKQVCGNHTTILQSLSSRFSQKPRAMGLSSNGKLIEILVSSRGSWTMSDQFPKSADMFGCGWRELGDDPGAFFGSSRLMSPNSPTPPT